MVLSNSVGIDEDDDLVNDTDKDHLEEHPSMQTQAPADTTIDFTLFGRTPDEAPTGSTHNVNLFPKKKKRRRRLSHGENPISMLHVPGSSIPPGEIYEWIVILHNTRHEDQEEASIFLQSLAQRSVDLSSTSSSERFVLENTNHGAFIEIFDIRNRWPRGGTGSWTEEECRQRSRQLEQDIQAWRQNLVDVKEEHTEITAS